MKLVTVQIASIYNNAPLPASMAQLTEDAAVALKMVAADFKARGCVFRLSDCYRSSAMQARAHDDWLHGRKKAYSPPAGSSMHEAGRAIDIDLGALIAPSAAPLGATVLDENEVRSILSHQGWTPISAVGSLHSVDVSESWHFECRGAFQKVYDDVLKKTGNRSSAYVAMTHAAIADLENSDSPVAGVIQLMRWQQREVKEWTRIRRTR
jgi:D-alanyl-D-alanine dipeptidase